MTIVQPNRDKQLTSILRLLLAAIGVSLIICVVFYNRMITQRAAFRASDKLVGDLSVSSSELKNRYYELLDNQNLDKAASDLGYIKDSNPNYLRLSAAQNGQKEISLSR